MSLLTKKNKLILLFLCGFLAGICLEILLIEKGKAKQRSYQDSLNKNINISCLVLIKHENLRYVNSSKKTWLKHCSNYNIVKIRRSPKIVKQTLPKTELSFKNADFSIRIKNYSICSKNDGEHKIFANSAWAGLCKALHFVKPNHFQWLVIVPDSLVVLVENLKLFVFNLDCDESHYYGYALKNYEADYNVLSAGILLSRGTLKKLLDKFDTEESCDVSGKHWKNEDLYLGKHLKQMNIFPKDSRDEKSRGRFHGYNMNNILWPGKLFMKSEYNRKALYPVSKGFNCCNPFLITIDVSDPDSMSNLYFFLYLLKTVHKKLPEKVKVHNTEGTYWKTFLKEEGYNDTQIKSMTNEEYYKIWEKKLPEDKISRDMKDFLKSNREKFD